MTDISNFKELSDIIKKREKSLEGVLKSPLKKRFPFVDETTFLIARRWNSWYPSFFNTVGGCYVLIPARQKGQKDTDGLQVIVVDPGFKFLHVLRSVGIGVADISKVIITHLHPDHMGGFFELVSLAHTLNLSTIDIIANETSRRCLEKYYDYPIKSIAPMDLTARYERNDGLLECLSLIPFPTVHDEVSGGSATTGLRILIETQRNNRMETKCLTILGDTSYNPAENTNLIDHLVLSDVSVLHLGSFQERQKTAKHLYIKGLDDLIRSYRVKWMEQKRRSVLRPLILISEFGLEHATEKQLRNSLYPNLDESSINFDLWRTEGQCPIIQIGNYFSQKSLEWATILPADIGLEISFGKEVQVVTRTTDPVKAIDPMFIEPVYADEEIKYRDAREQISSEQEFTPRKATVSQREEASQYEMPVQQRLYYKIIGNRHRNAEKALEMSAVAIELFPSESMFHALRASIQAEIGDFLNAKKSIDEAIKLDRNNPHHWIDKISICKNISSQAGELSQLREDFIKKFPRFIKESLDRAGITEDYVLRMSYLSPVLLVDENNEEARRILDNPPTDW